MPNLLGAYAQVLLGFLRDCVQANAKLPLDSSKKLYIIELGAGSGKFSFFMIKVLDALNLVSCQTHGYFRQSMNSQSCLIFQLAASYTS